MSFPTPSWQGTTALMEQPNSPSRTVGETIKVTRIFRGPYDTCLAAQPYKGDLGTGGIVNNLLVTDSTVAHDRANVGVLTINYEGLGDATNLPPDELTVGGERVDVALEKHKRYANVLAGAAGRQRLEDIRSLLLTPYDPDDDVFDPRIYIIQDDVTDDTRTDLGCVYDVLVTELYDKMVREFKTYVVFPPDVQIVTYSLAIPTDGNMGGTMEVPYFNGLSIETIFPGALTYNFLRKGDKIAWNGTYWKIEKSWMAGPNLDTDIYPQAADE